MRIFDTADIPADFFNCFIFKNGHDFDIADFPADIFYHCIFKNAHILDTADFPAYFSTPAFLKMCIFWTLQTFLQIFFHCFYI